MAKERKEEGGKGQWPLLPSSPLCCIHFSVMKPFPPSFSLLECAQCSTTRNWIYLWDNTCYFPFSAPPVFLVTPPSVVRATVGSSASLDCVSAGNPAPTVFWSKERGEDDGGEEGGELGLMLPGEREEDVERRLRVRQEGTLVIGE